MTNKTRPLSAAAILALAGILATGTAHAAFEVTVEAPGVENSTSNFDVKGVETFDSDTPGTNQNLSTDFGLAPGLIHGVYKGVDILAANNVGGAGGTGDFPRVAAKDKYTLTLTGSEPINYFGFWLSALDTGNTLTFSEKGKVVFTFDPADLVALVGTNPAYFGNPSGAFAGARPDQPYAFVNFYDMGDVFDTITFTQTGTTGAYESDNHTVGYYNSITGTPIGPVPEPETYALMLAGLGALGIFARRRKSA
jgi:hypothetical protein